MYQLLTIYQGVHITYLNINILDDVYLERLYLMNVRSITGHEPIALSHIVVDMHVMGALVHEHKGVHIFRLMIAGLILNMTFVNITYVMMIRP